MPLHANGCSKRLSSRPQRVQTLNVPFGYVEGLNDVRTPLEALFNSRQSGDASDPRI